jgi:hypothetical protein
MGQSNICNYLHNRLTEKMMLGKYIAGAVTGLALLAGATSVYAAPGDMSAAAFMVMADGLKAKGMAAMFSGDLKKIMAEARGAGENYRARLAADKAAGRPPHSCPPPKARMDSKQFMAQINSYSPEQRAHISMNSVMADLFAKNYPCPK